MGTTPQHPGCSNGHSIGLQQVDKWTIRKSNLQEHIFGWWQHSNILFFFTSQKMGGRWSHFDLTHTFQMDWFNHQLGSFLNKVYCDSNYCTGNKLKIPLATTSMEAVEEPSIHPPQVFSTYICYFAGSFLATSLSTAWIFARFWSWNILPSSTHRIHGTGIFTYIWLIFMVSVGK